MQCHSESLTSLDPPSVEIQPLLHHHSDARSHWSKLQHKFYHSLRYLCLPSKAAILVLFWTAVVGAIYQVMMSTAVLVLDNSYTDITIRDLLPYALLAILMMFYPLSGFIADIFCGRFKTIMFSLLMFVLSLLFFSVAFVLFLVTDVYISIPISTLTIFCSIFSVLATACFTVGLAGCQANFIQFGLDQLLEAPSVYLGLFVHWAKWAYNVSATAVSILFAVTVCYYGRQKFVLSILLILPVILIISLVFLLILSCCKRIWFNIEPGQENPYKTVFKVLNFARKHRSPPRRSAFTYSDNNRPSRIDFAKERFGGPFTNEQVENVKTFLRILIILLVLGLVHVLQVPASQFFYSIFGFHVGHRLKNPYHGQNCSTEWMMLLQSGVLMQFTSVIALPIYTWFIFSLLHRRIPKMFTRLGLGIAIFLLGVFSMFVIDLVGHIKSQNETLNETFTSKCMFHMNFACLLYTSPSPRDATLSRMPSSA